MTHNLRRPYHFAFGLALTGAVAVTAPVQAEERVCNTSLGAIVVDNLRVPANGTCRLTRTRVKGTILVERNAALFASRVVVIGNVQAEGARNVQVYGRSRVGGSVQIGQGGAARVLNSIVDGSIQLTSNTRALEVSNNTVGADVQAFSNTGGVEISDNAIDGNLQCKSNRPAPTGGGNTVQGAKEDQCRSL